MIKIRFRRGSILSVGLMSGAAFLALAVFGWDFPIETVLVYLAICIGFVIIIAALALVTVWLLKLIGGRNDNHP